MRHVISRAKPVNDKPEYEESLADLLPGVKKLAQDRVNLYHERPKASLPPARGAAREEQKFDFADLSFQTLSQISDSYFAPGLQKKLQRQLRQGQFAIDGMLDLHGCTQSQARKELTQFLQQARGAGYRMLVIVHGKGNRSDSSSVLKPLVQHWLARQSAVLAWCPAQPRHGSVGASYVYLRSSTPD